MILSLVYKISFVKVIVAYHFGAFSMGYVSFWSSFTTKKPLLSTRTREVFLLFYANCRGIISSINRKFVRTVMKVLLCEDADWLMSEEAFSIYASCMYHPTYEDYKAQMEDYLLDSSVKVFVSENRGKKTGMMVLRLSEDDAEIIGIAVTDNARHKGIGKQLIQRIMKSENLESFKAQTDDDSIGFYRKCGFSDERIVIEYPDGAAVRYNCVLH